MHHPTALSGLVWIYTLVNNVGLTRLSRVRGKTEDPAEA